MKFFGILKPFDIFVFTQDNRELDEETQITGIAENLKSVIKSYVNKS